MTASAPRKPAGGITAVTVTCAHNLRRVTTAADGRHEAAFDNGAMLIRLPVAEERSSYTEQVDTDSGVERVRHTLSVVMDREAARALLDAQFGRMATCEGLVSLVTMASGEQLLVGWSARLGTEQPLRLDLVRIESGQKPLDGTPVTLTLTSEDADRALEITPQEQ